CGIKIASITMSEISSQKIMVNDQQNCLYYIYRNSGVRSQESGVNMFDKYVDYQIASLDRSCKKLTADR
ncbi:MAG: hypothetical protein ACKPBB_00560, partial [Sphaerospermopsis kisseleviana]